MRTKNSMLNMLVGVVGQLLSLILAFAGRLVFIHYLSSAYLGVNGLFSDVLGMLNLAELGIGSAMIFSLYLPAANNDEAALTRLMNLYRLLYRAVAGFVLVIGLCLMPFLRFLIKGGEGIEHLYLIYLLYLLQSVSSYLLSYKNSIYLAYQKAYLKTALDQVFSILRLLGQIAVLVLTQNFILYLMVQLFVPLLSSVVISRKVDREFPYLKNSRDLPEKDECRRILKNIGALSMHKLATVVVRGTDNLLMSAFVGLSTVGIYSNYKLVLTNITYLVSRVTTAFTGSIGNLYATESRARVYEIYRVLDLCGFLLYGYLAGGMAVLFNLFVRLVFGADYLFSQTIVLIIVAEFFISGLRQINLQFREAMGLFWYDRYKAIAEAAINLVVSIFLAQRWGVAGIIGGTIISSVTTCVWVEPYVLMRYGMEEAWQEKLKCYFSEYARRIAVVAGAAALSHLVIRFLPDTNLGWFVVDGLLYTAVFGVLILLIYSRTEEFQYLWDKTLRKLHSKLHHT